MQYSYNLDRTYQFGLGLPVNAGFDSLSQVPNQLSLNQTLGAEWNWTNWQRAVDSLQQALPLQRATGNKFGEASTLNNLAAFHMQVGKLQQALEYYSLALPLQQAVSNQSGVAVVLNNLGETYRLLGDYEQARAYFHSSLELRRTVKDRRNEGITLNNIGLSYLSEGLPAHALEYFTPAMPLRQQTGDKAGEATSFNNIGAAYFRLDDQQKALEYLPQGEVGEIVKVLCSVLHTALRIIFERDLRVSCGLSPALLRIVTMTRATVFVSSFSGLVTTHSNQVTKYKVHAGTRAIHRFVPENSSQYSSTKPHHVARRKAEIQ